MKSSRHTVIVITLVFLTPLVGLWLHYLSGLHFPYPWPDETLFLFPAANFYERWSTAAPELNAPQGIFWMQDGYYVVMGLLSHLIGASIESFRHASFGFSLIFYFSILYYTYRSHLKNNALIMPVLWFLSPITVAFSNYARMEALIFALLGLFLCAISFNRFVIACCLLILAATIHPAGVAFSAFFCLFLVLDFRSLRAVGTLRIGWLEVLVIIATVSAVAWQGIYWLNNVELLLAHMEIQFARKVDRGYLERFSDVGSVFVILSAGAILSSFIMDYLLERKVTTLWTLYPKVVDVCF